jgi:glycosyltransferase involved in cell wall biosynthesis
MVVDHSERGPGPGSAGDGPATTVLMATRNRAERLERTLEAFARLEAPGPWTLVIVDNGSVDRTPAVVAAFQRRLPIIHLHEPHPGKNRALNAALAHIAGDLVVCTDDDVVPRPDWLKRLRAAADAHPEFAIFGGTILPLWEKDPEPWIVRWVPLGACFTVLVRDEGPCPALRVYGPNMAIRAAVFARGYRFNAAIGPDGSTDYPMGSETELVLRLERDGYRAWHCKDAVVSHVVRPEQLDERWILNRAYRLGRGLQLYGIAWTRRWEPRLRGLPLTLLLVLGVCRALAVVLGRFPSRGPRFVVLWYLQLYSGVADQILLSARGDAARCSAARQ